MSEVETTRTEEWSAASAEVRKARPERSEGNAQIKHLPLKTYHDTARRLVQLGLSYISLDRAASTLSTGERQRMQLARAVRNRTTGVLYVLDEPSIGLHPSNLEGLIGVMDDLIADGNTVVLVDHDTQVLSHADWIVELGPEAGAKGGNVIALGTVENVCANPASRIGPFLQRAMEERRG